MVQGPQKQCSQKELNMRMFELVGIQWQCSCTEGYTKNVELRLITRSTYGKERFKCMWLRNFKERKILLQDSSKSWRHCLCLWIEQFSSSTAAQFVDQRPVCNAHCAFNWQKLNWSRDASTVWDYCQVFQCQFVSTLCFFKPDTRQLLLSPDMSELFPFYRRMSNFHSVTIPTFFLHIGRDFWSYPGLSLFFAEWWLLWRSVYFYFSNTPPPRLFAKKMVTELNAISMIII